MTGVVPTVRRAEVEGVPLFSVDHPGRVHASLVFGVGIRDESPTTCGITHLVEHLAMRQTAQDGQVNASVSSSVTQFDVVGHADFVAGHLEQVCRALGNLDLGPLDLERGVLRAEEAGQEGGAWAVGMHYGTRGPGMVGLPQVGVDLVTAEQVRSWTSRWFHRGNVALAVSGEIPARLHLPLPAGRPVPRTTPQPLPLRTPAWMPDVEGVQAAMRAEWSAELVAGLDALRDRLMKSLRYDAGLVYDVLADAVGVDAATAVVSLGVDVSGPAVWTTVQSLLDVLDGLCADGPTEAELERNRNRLVEALAEPDLIRDMPVAEAAHHLTGIVPDHHHYASALQGVDPADVARALHSARQTLVLGVPETHVVHRLPQLPVCTATPVVGRTLGRRRFGSAVPRGSALTVAPDGLTMRVGADGPECTIRFDEVAFVATEPTPDGPDGDDVHIVVSTDGALLMVRAKDWKDGADAVDAIEVAVPGRLRYRTPERLRRFGRSPS